MAHRDGEGNADEKHERRARIYAIQPATRTRATAGLGYPRAAASVTEAAGVREALERRTLSKWEGTGEHNKREMETQLHSSSNNNNNKHQQQQQPFKGNLLRGQPAIEGSRTLLVWQMTTCFTRSRLQSRHGGNRGPKRLSILLIQ